MEERKAEGKIGVSFSAGGWLMNYLFGVAKGLQRVGVQDHCRLIGSSAGALTAVGLALDADFDQVLHRSVECYGHRARASISGLFNGKSYIKDCLSVCGNLHRYEELGEHRHATVCYTELLPSLSAIRQSRFRSQDDLSTALVASCTATPIAGLPFFRKGKLVMDGGFLDFQPTFGRGTTTITISPFYFSNADIRPSRYVPAWWSIYPPTPSEYCWVYTLGYNDALQWIRKNVNQLPWIYTQIQNPKLLRAVAPRRPVLKHISATDDADGKKMTRNGPFGETDSSCLEETESDDDMHDNHHIHKNSNLKNRKSRVKKRLDWEIVKGGEGSTSADQNANDTKRFDNREWEAILKGENWYPPRRREKSLRRFLGYDVRLRFLDVFFLAMLWLVWRPIAFSILYWELGLNTLITIILGIVQCLFYVLILSPRKAMRSLQMTGRKLSAGVMSIFSLSLLLSSIPYYNSHLPAERRRRRHSVMLRQSITYRFFQHIL